MHRFSNLKLHASWAAAAILLSTGCTKPAKGPTESGSFFNVHKLEAGASQNMTPGRKWEIYDSVTYSFHACVAGSSAHERVLGQRFSVEVPGSSQAHPVKTDPTDGCFNWDETFEYNYFAARSGWVTMERDVVGTGSYIGKQRIRFAINPWAFGTDHRDHESTKFISLLEGERDLPQNVNLVPVEQGNDFLMGKIQGVSRLHAQNAKVSAIPEGEGRDEDGNDFVQLRVVVELEPEIQDRDSINGTHYHKITDGQFGIRIQMLGANMGPALNQKMALLSGGTYTVATSRNGTVTAEFLVRQIPRPNQANLELAVNVQPIDLNPALAPAPYNAVFRMGPGTTVKEHKGTLSSQCEEKPEECEFTKVVQQAANFHQLAEKDALKPYATPNSRYIFSTLKLRFIQILPGETTTRRTVLYEAQTCITDNQTGKALANTPLVVHYKKNPDEKEYDAEIEYVPRTTDESGCLSWNGRAFHKYYEPEKYFEKNVEILKGVAPVTNEKGLVTGLKGEATFRRELKFYLNPWDDKFTFGWDAREFTEDFFRDIKKRPKIKSRFFLSDYNYHTVRFLYNIDQFMELDVKKWVLMGVVPQVLRYSGIINARKMVEHLRDGIYLMKVGIQKSYLDPRDNTNWQLQNNLDLQASMERMNGAELEQREYITTNTVLVRVVDGVIVYPVELTMRDLRLMRVRSNMMIQLEMVDERLIQAYHVFKQHGISIEKIKEKLEEYRKGMPEGLTADDMSKDLENDKTLNPALKDAIKQRRELAISPDKLKARDELAEKIGRIQSGVELLLKKLKKTYEMGGSGLVEEISSECMPADNVIGSDCKPTGNSIALSKDGINLAPMQMSKSQMDALNEELNQVLQINDFSTVQLPKKEEIDLNIFAEQDSGLEKRSFVGPVIFLSNAYSDSMRATDNLDEAGCVPRNKDGGPASDLVRNTLEELEIDKHYVDTYRRVESDLAGNRQNNAYQYSKYFNSLSHLCYMNVDDLITKEKELRRLSLQRSQAAALKYNFIKTFNLDFVSLTNEPMQKVHEGCQPPKTGEDGEPLSDKEYDKALAACLENTSEDTVPVEKLKGWINTRLDHGTELSNHNPENVIKRMRGIPFRVERTGWNESEYHELFYKHSLESKVGLCNLLSNRMSDLLHEAKLSSVSEIVIHEKVMEMCALDGGLIHDIKYRVDRTGKYTFLGGLNLNLNVSEGFSVGTSSGWSTGMEITDLVGIGGSITGGGLLKGAALAVKPANLKYGTGLNKSEGTSVSESTYLVSQIAGFDVELSAYERCAWVGLSADAIHHIESTWGDSSVSRAIGLGTADFSDPRVQKIFHRGLFVCEGATRDENKPVTVPENYFYFTQHFTEGDMLDQADLYNHPWLLSLRGMRDFSTFVEKIRAQRLVNFSEFLYHVTGTADERPKGWALDHLAGAYATVTPTFPGFYTVLDRGEPQIDQFALQQAANRQKTQSVYSKVDKDPLKEVNHGKLYRTGSGGGDPLNDRIFGPVR